MQRLGKSVIAIPENTGKNIHIFEFSDKYKLMNISPIIKLTFASTVDLNFN